MLMGKRPKLLPKRFQALPEASLQLRDIRLNPRSWLAEIAYAGKDVFVGR